MSATIEWVDGTGNTLLVELDATPTQAWESTAEVTKHPVETGSAIGDHVKPANDTITVEGILTNTPVIVPATQMQGATRAPGTLDLPGGGSVSVQRWSGPFDRVSECRELLRSLVKAGLPATLSTGRREGLRFDDNLVLVRFRVDRDATTGNSINVSLDFEQLRVVSTSRVAVPAVRRLQVPESRGTAPPVPAGSAAYNYVVGG
ncbi:MAG: hypothetical protein IPF99_24350 [Deltaproteobacteria bacterium]|jgi:hypothetical protein|nr:hypothetical protein [Deltaproteobacteria bacterium]MBK7066886.1 hypothetical protein [Deltaproteobacteria bacterium]MBP6829471.1 hypothetical protein [Deltaproteobacteria bacterium]